MDNYSGNSFSDSALIIPVVEVEDIVQPYRQKYTTDGAMGLLPHVTILYPFITLFEWDLHILESLENIFSQFSSFNFELVAVNRFPSHKTLFLDPIPKQTILDLTRAIVKAFPDHPPYEGKIRLDELHPHMTIAIGSTDQELDAIEESFKKQIEPRLPYFVPADTVWFVVKSNNRWQRHTIFNLGEKKGQKS